MTVRRRILLLAFATWLVATLVILATCYLLLLPGFSRMERAEAQGSMRRAIGQFNEERNALKTTTADWACWDGAYSYAQGRNPGFIAENLTPEAISGLNVNVVGLFDLQGRLLWGRSLDPATHRLEAFPDELRPHLTKNSPLFLSATQEKVEPGAIALPRNVLFLVVHPIHRSNRKGSPGGVLVMGRYLTKENQKDLARQAQVTLSVYRADQSDLPADLRAARPGLAKRSIVTRALNEDFIAAYAAVEDVYGRPALLARIEVPRTLYHEQAKLVLNFIVFLMLAFAALAIVLNAVMDRAVLARLVAMAAVLQRVAGQRDPSLRLPEGGGDEFATLATSINHMLGALEESKQTVQESESRLRTILDSVHAGFMMVDAETHEIVAVNAAARAMLGGEEHEVIGTSCHGFACPNPAGHCPITDLGETVKDRECVVPRRDGTLTPVLKTAVRVTFSGREYILESFVDISKRKKAEAEIEHQAFHDGLTGLPNRTRFHEQLQESLAQARRDDQLLAVMFLDLDRFKTINDTLGHPVGDELLTRVAGRLSSCLRSHDSIARLGGDEFAVLVTGIDHPRGATGIAQRMVEALRAPFHINGFELHTTTSMGISLFPKDGTDAERLLQNADIALYHAKEQGRNTFRYYDSGVGVTAKERLTLETDLRHALERDQLVLHYQPQLHTPTGAIVGVESLLRWQHPDLGLLFPDKFIPLAEETGLIESIGEWVLQQACRQGKTWQEEGLHGLRVGVNLSPLQFHQPGLRHVITDTLHRTGFNPSDLELELTESAALRNLEASARIMGSLKSTGVRLCLDDFGVGYTSLVHLRQFPLDSVKIDRTFLRALEESPHDSAIISAILGIARSLGLGVIAEGVETVAQQHFLQQHGCEVMQGYLFSKPLPVAAATALLRARLAQSTAGLHV